MTLVYIHGSNATPNSWNYIKNIIGDGVMISYNSADGFKHNLNLMKEKLEDINDIEFISHSLGGLYSLHLAEHFSKNVRCSISLSTPYGGHDIPLIARYYFRWYRLIHDIIPNAWPIAKANEIRIKWPWTNIVTISGSVPWMFEPNDGVVSISSQKHRNDMELIEVNCNHYEIMLYPKVIDIIKSKLYN